MRRLLFGAFACALALDAVAQARFGTVPQPDRPASPAPETRPFAATPYRTPEAERCANFRRELRAARSAERQASTTTSRDQAATHRQQIVESMQKAGC